MERKRKGKEVDEEKIRRKIRKLEKKLQSAEDKSPSPLELPKETDELESIYMPPSEWAGSLGDTAQYEDFLWNSQEDSCALFGPEKSLTDTDSVIVNPSGTGFSPQPSTSADSLPPKELDESILNILGDAPKSNVKLGPKIHPDIATRWQGILSNGLQKSDREQLLEKYRIPENCDLLIAPTLNPEIKAALAITQVKRDDTICTRQKYMATALSALSQVIEMLINKETSTPKLLEPIIDAARLLCNNHFYDTRVRRQYAILSIDNSLKNTLDETKRDMFLFGENLGEKLKAAKNILRSGETLKNQKNVLNKNNNLNYRPLHQRPTGRFDAGFTRPAPRDMNRSTPYRRSQLPPPGPPLPTRQQPLPSRRQQPPLPPVQRNHYRR